jgi:hypothetical protein
MPFLPLALFLFFDTTVYAVAIFGSSEYFACIAMMLLGVADVAWMQT